jgi:hypothetical protein
MYRSKTKYYAHHIPSGEDWVLLGINEQRNEVCAAGWPPSIGKLSDCTKLVPVQELTEHELQYRNKEFGTDWI